MNQTRETIKCKLINFNPVVITLNSDSKWTLEIFEDNSAFQFEE